MSLYWICTLCNEAVDKAAALKLFLPFKGSRTSKTCPYNVNIGISDLNMS